MTPEAIEKIEVELLLEALRRRFGYDFGHYAPDFLHRRVLDCLSQCRLTHISDIIPRVLHDRLFLEQLISKLTVTTTALFRDPAAYAALIKQVFPMLETYPFFNIWHAGCSTGEEVYSLAILLEEAGLYDRCRIYATDINNAALERAREGVYPSGHLEDFGNNYLQAGGRYQLCNWFHARYDLARFDPQLTRNVLFSNHNLATDGVFAETHLILCRNVLIYFDHTLQNRVLELFHESLDHGGFLILGAQETLRFSSVHDRFLPVNEKERLWRKRHRDPKA
ncbi:MAG: protein-glutamate O-methyltransferase CheR [Magnetococcales bacterium]|nr:protein-glutamate O-methyltransferase CheR [Magnetococcales bacterium]MBF0148475.1 protein-glutamate O-methyltransferase CheR [Magnetococcales bacterium]MBF0172624.1 protein-glutamate O-methyltransferase CheR [Magnetococcales bacterium]MBF0629927.1 protein-glutamate O-methyltransferase CheR [Magnetococcales bacterium]